MSIVVNRNSTLPLKRESNYCTTADNVTQVAIKVYEGERLLASENNFLDKFDLKGIPPARKGEVTIVVTFEINNDGLLSVTAKENYTGKEANVLVSRKSDYTREQILTMIDRAKKYEIEERRELKRLESKHKLEDVLYFVQHQKNLNSLTMKMLNTAVDDTSKWLEKNQKATRQQYDHKLTQLKEALTPIFTHSGISYKFSIPDAGEKPLQNQNSKVGEVD